MDPGIMPEELKEMSMVEQQLICKIAPAISIHMLKHGGLASKGHCVTFPQEINEPCQILPKLPKEISIIKLRKKGCNATSKDFQVRRNKVQTALMWLKENNPAYDDIMISTERLSQLPLNGELHGGNIFEFENVVERSTDEGPAFEQINAGEGCSESGVLLPEMIVDLRQQVEDTVRSVVGPECEVTCNRKNIVTIPWPTRDNTPLSEFTTNNFFTMAFPTLFPYGDADFRMNRPRTITSMTEWAEHLLWYQDGRFAQHYFKFIAHNMILRKRALEQSQYIVQQKLGDQHMTIKELRDMLSKNDNSVAKKILYFGGSLRGSPQYWAQRSKELSSLIQFMINQEKGLPSFFTTGSCAEYYFKPLTKLLREYLQDTADKSICSKSELYEAVQKNYHVVTQYFDLRTKSYFNNIMTKVFGVETFWYRYEFAPSRGMVHWHGLAWRGDCEPHQLLYQAVLDKLPDKEMARELSDWAEKVFGMTASHPAGCDENGNARKDLWAPPEGTAPPPSEENNPLIKLLSEIGSTQESLLNDHILLTNKINIHKCSDFCWKKNKKGDKVCRMEFGTEREPGKPLREIPAIVNDKNGCLRLEMKRDHPRMVQHSRIHTQAWRANGDISLILSKSHPSSPAISEIIAAEKYVSGYACKGNQSTGALTEIFKDLAYATDEDSSVGSLCTKLMMKTVKRDVSGVEACHELSQLQLYRCSHQFQYVSLTGSRVLERTGLTATKATPLDKYLARDSDDNSSWYNFLARSGKVPVIHGNTYATWPITDEYARTMMLLHWPNWRKISDIIGDEKWLSKFMTFMQSEQCPIFVKAQIEMARKPKSSMPPDQEDQQDVEESEEQPDWLQLLQPNTIYDDYTTDFPYDDGGIDCDWSAKHQYPPKADLFINHLSTNVVDEEDHLILPEADHTLMNYDQKFAYNIIMEKIQKHSAGEHVNHRMVIAGQAGSGKSYLINCIVHSIRQLYQTNKSVQVLCPTGSSANLISGKTIHSFLKIPCGPKCLKDMSPPVGSTGERLQQNCEGLICLLVDERSLVGCSLLGWMEYHSQCGLKNNMEWGGVPVVVFFGDDIQLPSVCDSPVYLCCSSKPAAMRGALIWKGFDTAVELKQIVRQNSDQKRLKQVLNSLRTYTTNDNDTQWLQNFQWDHLIKKYGKTLMQSMKEDALFVFPTHEEEWRHNKTELMTANQSHRVAKITAECHGIHSKSSSAERSGGLVRVLYICISARINLTSNINVAYGLYNGAVGTVIDIVYPENKSPKDSLPEFVMVDFPKYTGPSFLEDHPTWIPVAVVQRRLDCQCCSRKQLPLRLGWGTTIHRCQGKYRIT